MNTTTSNTTRLASTIATAIVKLQLAEAQCLPAELCPDQETVGSEQGSSDAFCLALKLLGDEPLDQSVTVHVLSMSQCLSRSSHAALLAELEVHLLAGDDPSQLIPVIRAWVRAEGNWQLYQEALVTLDAVLS